MSAPKQWTGHPVEHVPSARMSSRYGGWPTSYTGKCLCGWSGASYPVATYGTSEARTRAMLDAQRHAEKFQQT